MANSFQSAAPFVNYELVVELRIGIAQLPIGWQITEVNQIRVIRTVGGWIGHDQL